MPWSLILRILGPLALLAALAAGVWWALADARADGRRAGEDAVRAEWAAATSAAEAAARAEEQRRTAAHQEITDAQVLQIAQLRADAAGAADAAGRLRERVADLLARSRQAASRPAPAAVGPPAEGAAGVLADVLGRCEARVQLLAFVADGRGAAGSGCERSYDALTP